VARSTPASSRSPVHVRRRSWGAGGWIPALRPLLTDRPDRRTAQALQLALRVANQAPLASSSICWGQPRCPCPGHQPRAAPA
jgi:hypothetical protein